MIQFLLKAGRAQILTGVACLVAIIAAADWSVGNSFSLGPLYILPMIVGAVVLPWPGTALLALLCAALRFCFDVPSTHTEAALRFLFASTSYFVSGLFVTALIRQRKLVAGHLTETQQHLSRIRSETELRREAEEQLRELVARSPAAILTMDGKGTVLAANAAADEVFALPEGQAMIGREIVRYIPLLYDALRVQTAGEFRTAAQCQGTRANGEIFFAHTWFSSYTGPEGMRLSAIIVDSSDEMRDREEQNLRQLQKSNRITAAAVSHELRNLCSAISLVCSQVEGRHNLADDEDFQGILNLVRGLEKMANFGLLGRPGDAPEVEAVPLQRVLDDLRIVIEPEWSAIEGVVRWNLPPELPAVLVDPHGLLQAFLNLAKNSHRAVAESEVRELEIIVIEQDSRVLTRFRDSGPGVPCPERLFRPFQEAADGAGLGLYVSRAMVRSYGGDLRYEPSARGSCFAIELQRAI